MQYARDEKIKVRSCTCLFFSIAFPIAKYTGKVRSF